MRVVVVVGVGAVAAGVAAALPRRPATVDGPVKTFLAGIQIWPVEVVVFADGSGAARRRNGGNTFSTLPLTFWQNKLECFSVGPTLIITTTLRVKSYS